MSVRFPPIAALRALESAARHLSYTRAAEELHVTQSAISHQIHHAEELWNLKLFEKRGRRVVLTEAGQALVPVVRDFIRRITSTLEELADSDDTPVGLRVTLLQSFAYKWLVPRLGGFTRSHPDIDIWISTTDKLFEFDPASADLGIRLGYGNTNDLHEELLLSEYVFPVCSPYFLKKNGVPQSPRDLLELPLLRRQAVDILPRWRDWFRDAGFKVPSVPGGTKFPQTSLALQAAIDHQGIALARSAHVLDDIKAGRLVILFPEVISKSAVSYFLVCGPGRQDEPEIAAFSDWLRAECAIAQSEFEQMVSGPGMTSDEIPADVPDDSS